MPAAAIIVGAIAVETGIAAAIGTAFAGSVGLTVAASGVTASLAAGTISAAVATAVGSGVISAGLTAIQGGSVSDVLKSAVIGGVASFAGATVAESVAGSIAASAAEGGTKSALSASLSKVAVSMAGGAASSATRAFLTGQDPVEALIKGGLTAGLTSGVMEGVTSFTKEIPGFSDLSKDYGKVGAAAQRAINTGLAAGVMGKDVDNALKASVLGSINQYVGSELSSGLKDLSGVLKTSYDTALASGNAIESNIKRQQQTVDDYNNTVASINRQHAELSKNYNSYLAASDLGDIATANSFADLVNAASPDYDASKAAAEAKLADLSKQLDSLKAELPGLEETFTAKKQELDASVVEFQKQEEANALLIAERFDDVLGAKEQLESLSGETIGVEKFDELLKGGDIVKTTEDLTKYLADDSASDKAGVKKALVDGDIKAAMDAARFEGYTPEFFGAQRGETWDDFSKSLQEKTAAGEFGQGWAKHADGSYTITGQDGSLLKLDSKGTVLEVADTADQLALKNKSQDEMTPEDWRKLYATPTTDPVTGKTIVGADPSSYSSEYDPTAYGGIEGLGWDARAQQLLYQENKGELPSQWQPGANGTYIYTGDDGSTLTLGANGEVLSTTEAPAGMLLSDLLKSKATAKIPSKAPAAPAAKPPTAAPVAKPPTKPSTKPVAKAPSNAAGTSNADLSAFLAALGGASSSDEGQAVDSRQPNAADVQLMENIFGTSLDLTTPTTKTANAARGGSVNELLQLLRG